MRLRLADLLRSKGKAEDSTDTTRSETLMWREEVQSLPIAEIRRNPYQPRVEFDQEPLEELAASIKEHGVLHPVVVRRLEVGYELVVGERRLRACKLLGWDSIPAIVRDMTDTEVAELALIENIQREGLHFFEEAEALRRLVEEFGLTQDELATRLGKSQSAIANKLRLLRLPGELREIISREMLSERHARALLRLDSEAAQKKALDAVVKGGLNVRQTEEWIDRELHRAEEEKPKRRQTVRGVYRDYRLLLNSVKQLVTQMKQGGSNVEFSEESHEDYVEIRIRVPKQTKGSGS